VGIRAALLRKITLFFSLLLFRVKIMWPSPRSPGLSIPLRYHLSLFLRLYHKVENLPGFVIRHDSSHFYPRVRRYNKSLPLNFPWTFLLSFPSVDERMPVFLLGYCSLYIRANLTVFCPTCALVEIRSSPFVSLPNSAYFRPVSEGPGGLFYSPLTGVFACSRRSGFYYSPLQSPLFGHHYPSS